MMKLNSPDLQPGSTIPQRFTCEGQDVSPAFGWKGVPEGTKELLLVCNDPDAPRGVFHHWCVFGIPPETKSLPEGFGAEAAQSVIRQAINDFGRPGYAGPCPPHGDKPHAYHFRLSALREPVVAAGPDARCEEIIRLAQPHEIEAVELIGYFGRA